MTLGEPWGERRIEGKGGALSNYKYESESKHLSSVIFGSRRVVSTSLPLAFDASQRTNNRETREQGDKLSFVYNPKVCPALLVKWCIVRISGH